MIAKYTVTVLNFNPGSAQAAFLRWSLVLEEPGVQPDSTKQTFPMTVVPVSVDRAAGSGDSSNMELGNNANSCGSVDLDGATGLQCQGLCLLIFNQDLKVQQVVQFVGRPYQVSQQLI